MKGGIGVEKTMEAMSGELHDITKGLGEFLAERSHLTVIRNYYEPVIEKSFGNNSCAICKLDNMLAVRGISRKALVKAPKSVHEPRFNEAFLKIVGEVYNCEISVQDASFGLFDDAEWLQEFNVIFVRLNEFFYEGSVDPLMPNGARRKEALFYELCKDLLDQQIATPRARGLENYTILDYYEKCIAEEDAAYVAFCNIAPKRSADFRPVLYHGKSQLLRPVPQIYGAKWHDDLNANRGCVSFARNLYGLDDFLMTAGKKFFTASNGRLRWEDLDKVLRYSKFNAEPQ